MINFNDIFYLIQYTHNIILYIIYIFNFNVLQFLQCFSLEKTNLNNAKPEVVNKLNKKTQWKAWEIYGSLGQTIKVWRQGRKIKIFTQDKNKLINTHEQE